MLHPAQEGSATGIEGLRLSLTSRGQASNAPSQPRSSSRSLKLFGSAPIARMSSFASKVDPSSSDTKADWKAEYLTNLRSNRIQRPSGARPLPTADHSALPLTQLIAPPSELPARTSSSLAFRSEFLDTVAPLRCSSALSHRRGDSESQATMLAQSSNTRPTPLQPQLSLDARIASLADKPSIVQPSGTYTERGLRWMERQEAHSLREALQDMDLKDEQRLHSSAQDEASELVWQHLNSGAPHKYRAHLEKGSHARSMSFGQSISGSANNSSGNNSSSLGVDPLAKANTLSRKYSSNSSDTSKPYAPKKLADANKDGVSKKAGVEELSIANLVSRPSRPRKNSGSRARNVSGGLFRNPNDQIYEEPENEPSLAEEPTPIPAPLRLKPKNTLTKAQLLPASHSIPGAAESALNGKLSRLDHRGNNPSQLNRTSNYVSNELIDNPSSVVENEAPDPDTPKMKNGLEIRGEDIRQATSMKLKDRSPKLPIPTAVSNSPGRPIVSFDRDWKPEPPTIDPIKDPARFTCLECVAFYPEPEIRRVERLDRINRRAQGQPVEEIEGQTWAEDGDESLRFYCHLDFHELFSPRCRNCKTPIEGEIVIACGGEWHVGHFFCAECGDECGSQFEDGRYFVREDEQTPVCVRCEEVRLKA
ncbi:MAG: hypothetical protein M1829_004052 [Trizodia sp. TS-e1964]|nr:MAG: hypothetical protein M1829_004052 [Trizodia sp. TS-e1964]